MNPGSMVAVKCTITRGPFSSERVLRLTLPNGQQHIAAALLDYFLDTTRQPLSPDLPAQRGTPMAGFVAGRILETGPGDTCLVSLPSGDVVYVNRSEMIAFPTESSARVPFQS
jgi:hypothetical protein